MELRRHRDIYGGAHFAGKFVSRLYSGPFAFRRPEMDTFIPRLLFRTLLPGLFFSWLYFAVLRQVNSGGGDPQPYFSVIVQTLALASGGPFAGAGAYVAANSTSHLRPGDVSASERMANASTQKNISYAYPRASEEYWTNK